MVEYTFKPTDVFPSKIKSRRLDYVPLHEAGISVREFYDKFANITPKSAEGVNFEPFDSVIEAKDRFEQSREDFNSGERARYAMILREDSTFIGTTGLDIRWDRDIAESGVFVFEEFWNNGYGTERGNTMLELAFDEYDIGKWVSRCTIDNIASQKSIEKYVVENGGQKYGKLPNKKMGDGRLEDLYIYVITQEEYRE